MLAAAGELDTHNLQTRPETGERSFVQDTRATHGCFRWRGRLRSILWA
jgi:hypothetical protein